MNQIPSFNALIQKSIIDHWDLDALTDYKGATLQYHDVARKIEKLHIMFENSGVEKGDKIALCGRNSANWAVAFLATLTYGAVAVPILHELIAAALNILNDREQKIIKSFYGIGCQEMTLEEIGHATGLTRERVRQIKEKAIRKLRNSTSNKLLKTYLGV